MLPASQRDERIPLFAQVNSLLDRYVRMQMILSGVMSIVTIVVVNLFLSLLMWGPHDTVKIAG